MTSGSAAPNSPVPPAAAGAVAGRFDLLQELGSGSSGQVYRARLRVPFGDLAAGEEVAVKFLRPELLDDEKAHARLFAEGEVGQALHHPNVAEIYGVETVELLGVTTSYLVMEYIAGTTLRDFLARSGAPVEDLTRRLGADAAKGLSALHRRGLVHRDVKPENLILTPQSELKIVDLGLAKPFGTRGSGSGGSPGSGGSGSGGGGSAGSGSGGSGPGGGPGSGSGSDSPSPGSPSPGSPSDTARAGRGGSSPRGSGGRSGLHLAGSLAYSAPEVLRGDPASPRSDLYALGIVLFEVTTGRHPFADATAPDTMIAAHLNETPPRASHLRPRVSPFLDQLLCDLLQKEPDQRPRDASELARILEQGERSEYWRRYEAKLPVLASSRRLLRMRRPAETAFHGRRLEQQRLDEAMASAARGRGRVVEVVGPDGMGRRRLLDEVMQQWLEDHSPLYLGGEADSELGHGEPFASSVLDWLLRGDAPSSPNALQRASTAARTLLQLDEGAAEALVAVAAGTSTEAPEVRANRLVSALLQLAHKKQVLVIRVDHAEELDTSGRMVLRRLAAAAPQHHLLVLLAQGPDAPASVGAVRLELSGLDEAEFLRFGAELFRSGEPVEEFLRSAHQVLSGLPGNLLEALDHMVQEGTLRGRAGDYHDLAEGAEPRPAPGLLERFRTRVAGLDQAQRLVLSAAAVLGERCELADLAGLVGSSELAVLETLSLFRGRIVRAQGGEVSFRHRDFRKALLRELPAEERQRLHMAAAALLEQSGHSRLEVGMHRSMALDHQGCLDPLLDGLDERVRAGSRRTAMRLLGRLAVHLAQVAANRANQRRQLRFLLLAAKARANHGQDEAAIRSYRQAEALARELHDEDAAATARIGIANGELDCGRLLSAIALLEALHDELANRTGDTADALAAQAHGLHGRILLYRGQAQDGLRHLQAAVNRVPLAADDLRCHLLIDLARVEALNHLYGRALLTLQEVEREPASRNLLRARLRFHVYRGQVRAMVGLDDAGQDLRLAIDESERLSLPTYGSRAAVFLGERLFWKRRDDEAIATFRRAVGLARAGNDRLGEAMARTYLARLGDREEGLEAMVLELELPEIRANLLLARALTGGDPGPVREVLAELVEASNLPLSMQLRALHWLGRDVEARTLVRNVAAKLPQRGLRQSFLSLWGTAPRL